MVLMDDIVYLLKCSKQK